MAAAQAGTASAAVLRLLVEEAAPALRGHLSDDHGGIFIRRDGAFFANARGLADVAGRAFTSAGLGGLTAKNVRPVAACLAIGFLLLRRRRHLTGRGLLCSPPPTGVQARQAVVVAMNDSGAPDEECAAMASQMVRPGCRSATPVNIA